MTMVKLNIGGCEFILTPRTAQAVRNQLAADAWENELPNAVAEARRAWERSQDPSDWDYYSDLYKDLNGFRPIH